MKPSNPIIQVELQLVTNSQNLTNTYTVSVFKSFSEISTKNSEPRAKYQVIASCVEEVALNTLTKLKKNKITQKSLSALDTIIKAREVFQKQINNYLLSPTEIANTKVDKARNNLQTAYDIATSEILQEKIKNILATCNSTILCCLENHQ